MKNTIIAMVGMFLLIGPLDGLFGMGFSALFGGGVEQSYIWPLYTGIIVLAGMIVGATNIIISKIDELINELKKSRNE